MNGDRKEHSEDPEQRGQQQLYRHENRGCEIDCAPGDQRHDQIGVDFVNQEIADDASDAIAKPAQNPTATMRTPDVIEPAAGQEQ